MWQSFRGNDRWYLTYRFATPSPTRPHVAAASYGWTVRPSAHPTRMLATRGRVRHHCSHFAPGSFRGPNATGLLTEWGQLNRERESLGGTRCQERIKRRSPSRSSELSRGNPSPQVVTPLAEKPKRRKLSLSASCVNPWVGRKFATRKSSPGRTRTYSYPIGATLQQCWFHMVTCYRMVG